MSKSPPSGRKVIRFSDARLQAVSSRNMYSEQGFDALIRPDAGQVCHSLMVVSYCTPGSADDQAAKPILSQSSRALRVRTTFPSVRDVRCHSSSSSTAWMKSFETRTELLEFWPLTVR